MNFNARFVTLVAGVLFFFLALVTQGVLPFLEPSARTTDVTAVVRTDLGQLKWTHAEATDYTAVQQLGRRVYLREGCWYCHSQYVRPVTGETRRSFAAIRDADSLVIDPHKHGLQPYGCGCVLFPDPTVGSFYKHDSPYTYFSSKELHLGEISLECSRPGAAAVALWATQRLLPLAIGGAFAEGLE